MQKVYCYNIKYIASNAYKYSFSRSFLSFSKDLFTILSQYLFTFGYTNKSGLKSGVLIFKYCFPTTFYFTKKWNLFI